MQQINLTTTKNIFLILSFSLLIVSCCGLESNEYKESVLNDIQLVDPSVISIDVSLERILDENNKPNNLIKVSVSDKHTLPVSLRKGNVMINGNLMKYSDMGYYTIDPSVLSVDANKQYTISVELADGKKYTANIKTPQEISEIFGEINSPADVYRNKDLNISWKNKPIKGDYNINVEIGNQEMFTQSLPDTSKENARFSIPASAFNLTDSSYKEGFVVLSVLTNGEVDKSFRSGSSIRSKLQIRRRFKLQ